MAKPRSTFGEWSWDIGSIAGITIRVHPTFLILLAWVALASFLAGHSVMAALNGALFLVLIFAIVVVHELSHALMARRFGIATRDITLLPIGGVSSLERIPEKPAQELAVALAGPLINVALALVLFGIDILLGGRPWEGVSLVGGSLLNRLAWVNVTLAVFNLIPAFPMDGGRVLRALLAVRLPRDRATDIAAGVGRALAVGFGLVGLFVNPLLLFIAWFVWVGASHEAQIEHAKSLLHGLTAQNAMVSTVQTLSPDDPIARAFAIVRESFQMDYPVVVQGDHPVGVVSRDALFDAMRAGRAGETVKDVMEEPVTSAPGEALDDTLAKLGDTGAHAAVVVDHEHLRGIVTQERLADFLVSRTRHAA